MKFSSPFAAWLLVALAVFAWAGVAWLSASLSDMAQQAALDAGDAQAARTLQSAAVRAHAVALSVAHDDAALEAALSNDPVALAQRLTQAGRDAGVAIQVGSASALPGLSSGGAIAFSLQGQGSFGALMRAALLLQTLPVPASIQTLTLGRAPGASAGTPWTMNAQIDVLISSSSISS